MAGESIDKVVLELEAREGRFRSSMEGAATTTDKALARIETSATRMERQVGRSFGNAAQQSRNLGYQISDIGVQLSAGTSPFLVLAQQGPQVANALEGARGAVGRFATFLSGPYGAAVLAATTLLGVWLSKNKEAGESVEDLVAKLQAQARQAGMADEANRLFSRTIEGVEKAVLDARKAVDALALAKKGEAAQTVDNIKKNLDDADAVRAATKARLDQAIAILELEQSGSESTFSNSAEGIAQQQQINRRIAGLKAFQDELARAEKAAADLRKEYDRAISSRTVEQENASAAEKINRKFDATIDRAATAANASKQSQAELRKEIALINKAREEELKREAASRRTSRGADIGDATRFISPVSGGRVTGKFGENRGSRNHGGIDIAVPVGTQVKAPAGGVVIEAGTVPGYGNVVYIDHGRGTISRLAHLSKIGVTKGAIVGQGDVVGLSGGARGAPGSGNSRGPHLHQEVRVNGRPVDPRKGAFSTDPASTYARAERAADDEERRLQAHQNEVAALLSDEISARRALVESAEDMAQLKLQSIELERTAYADNLRSLVEQGKLSEAEATERSFINDEIAKYRTLLVQRNEGVRKFRVKEAERQRNEQYDSAARADQAEILQGQAELARTLDERNAIERRLIDLKYQEEKSANDAVIASAARLKIEVDAKRASEEALADAQAQARIAAMRNASLGARKSGDLESLGRNNPLDRFIDDISDTKTRAQEAAVRQMIEVRDGISEGLAKELGIRSSFVRDMFSIFLDEVIFRPLTEALRNRDGGGGGIFGSILSGLGGLLGGGKGKAFNSAVSAVQGFGIGGLASGGYAEPHSVHRVNEHKGGVELLRMGSAGGTVIPLGGADQRLTQSGQQSGGIVRIIIEEGPNFMSTIRTEATGVAIEVHQAVAPTMINAAAQETQRRMSRPRMPGAGR